MGTTKSIEPKKKNPQKSAASSANTRTGHVVDMPTACTFSERARAASQAFSTPLGPTVCVRTSMQRKGHETRLLEALTDHLAPVRHWYLLTARDSDASAFYERNGFRLAGRMGVFVRR